MSQMWATAPVLAAALLFSGAAAERVTAQRTLLEIVDTQSAGCANNWDTATVALRWSHLVVKSVTLNTTAGRACTFTPPAQQCVTKAKLAALRAAGITVMAEVSHPDEAAWKACLDPGRSPTAVLAASLTEAVKDYDGVLFAGVAAQSAALLAAARVALPTSTVAGLSFPAESVNRVNAGQAVNLYDNLPALMSNSSASFVVLVYAGAVSSAAHMRSVAEKVGGIGNVVMGTCYGSASGCLSAKDYLGTLQAATLANGTLEWDGCVGGTLAMGTDNHFYYDTAALSVIAAQRRVCRDTLAAKTILQDNLKTLSASVFAPTSTVVRGSTRLDTSSFVGQFRAFALDSENFPRYPHRVSSVLDQFDSSDQLSEFGLVEEWGCVDGVSQDCGSGTTNGVLGYSDASLEFLKIGVGLLSRPESLRRANYSSTSRAYSMKRALQWQTVVSDDKASLTMTADDVLGDFAYTLTRTLTVKPFTIEVERSLKNTGKAAFSTAHITATNFDVDMLDLYYPETAVPRYETFLRFKGVTPKDGSAGSNAVSESFTQDTCLDGSLCRALAAKDGMFRVADVPRGDIKVDMYGIVNLSIAPPPLLACFAPLSHTTGRPTTCRTARRTLPSRRRDSRTRAGLSWSGSTQVLSTVVPPPPSSSTPQFVCTQSPKGECRPR